eukprot:CAMPEP_0197193348 /NCGR_PEP_ID=MMETSP1423-20130617/26990_1 /TAXON_ID=476441 /ORGANISM="Pseudo-nitzschia heimii, Strain UNC1101" /LENGTH=317 /DNA_ID=CAMNT_0042646525 /DNA_START=1 /DNA_END=952 /DNA_ORIENTATION=-
MASGSADSVPSGLLTPAGRENASLATNRRKRRKKLTAEGKKRQDRQQKKLPKSGQQLEDRNVVRPPKNYLKRLAKPRNECSIPPPLLVPTASPYVYISQTAIANNHDEEDTIDPSTLFSEVSYDGNRVQFLPTLLSKGDFHYFSPKTDLNYEYPTDGIAEIAFLGRSNVGKSSLINAIMRKNLCLTSRVPGRTQLPYYYGLVPKTALDQIRQHPTKSKGKDPKLAEGYIIDLPGYGYGRAPSNITEDWQKNTQDLLLQRRHDAGVLQRLFLLMDARRGMEGPNEHDRIVMRWLEDAEIPFSIVLTKADRVSVPIVVK